MIHDHKQTIQSPLPRELEYTPEDSDLPFEAELDELNTVFETGIEAVTGFLKSDPPLTLVKHVGKRVPFVVGPLVTGAFVLSAVTDELDKGNYCKASGEVIVGIPETLGNAVSFGFFGLGDVFHHAARDGFIFVADNVFDAKEQCAPGKTDLIVAGRWLHKEIVGEFTTSANAKLEPNISTNTPKLDTENPDNNEYLSSMLMTDKPTIPVV